MSQRGFTIIEILITIGLVAVIAMIAVPLTGSWLRDSDVQTAGGQLTQAIGQAQASGIRNLPGSADNAHVALVCINTANDTVIVRESTSSVVANCTPTNTATLLWQAKLNDRVEIVDGGDIAVNCICFNNRGLLTDVGGCASCFTGNDLVIKSASATEIYSVF